MEDAYGNNINLDRYSVKITTLPIVDNHQMTIQELFDYIRKRLGDFTDDNLTTFSDYPDTDFAESDKWGTNDYVGVIKVFTGYLHVGGVELFDDLGVVVSEQTSTSWTFSTIHTPATNNHAVSGNRQFGYTVNSDGTFTIYTRGADIATGLIDVLTEDYVFEGGEAIWNSFLDNIIEFVQLNSGSAGNKETTSNRYEID